MKAYMLDKDKNILAADIDHADWSARIEETIRDWWVSTVFLIFDHSHMNCHLPGYEVFIERPILFETMVKNTKTDEWSAIQERYCTWEEAEAGHEKIVQFIKDNPEWDGKSYD